MPCTPHANRPGAKGRAGPDWRRSPKLVPSSFRKSCRTLSQGADGSWQKGIYGGYAIAKSTQKYSGSDVQRFVHKDQVLTKCVARTPGL
jgi:hypothetical protein